MAELKPCPFCGNRTINIRKGKWAWVVECCNMECGAMLAKTLKKVAIEAWDRRVEHDPEVQVFSMQR